MFGQVHHFLRSAPQQVPYAIERYTKETRRLYKVLDGHLGEADYLAGEYSIADIATYPWVARHEWHKVDLGDFPAVKRWFAEVSARPAVSAACRCRHDRPALRQARGSLAGAQRQCARHAPAVRGHGAYTAAWCWAENFLPWFAEQGWQAHAISLSGHGGSAGRGIHSRRSPCRDVAEVARLAARPVLIGHSMGGFVVQKFLEREDLPAAVLMASVPPQGLLGSAVGMGFAKPGLMRDFGGIMSGGSVALETLREVLFAQPVSDERLRHYLRCMQPESHRAVWDMSMFDLPSISRMHRPPMLILGAEHDQSISAATVEMTGRAYGIKAEIFPAMGDRMMLDADWRKVAQRISGWLEQLPGLG